MSSIHLLPKMQARYAGQRQLVEAQLADAEAVVRTIEQRRRKRISLKTAEAEVRRLKRDFCEIILLQNGAIDVSYNAWEMRDENGEICY